KLKENDRYSVALVGTRTATDYGRQMAEKFSHDFAKYGITTVSGLARGIDTAVHAATLKGGGRTIGVVGSGADVIYPPENRDLAERIIADGAIISEFKMGAKPDAPNFPRRNRIVSGISLGTIIIETAVEGGAMITASLAFDQNREVFAVPGMVNEKRTSGCNLLIKQDKAMLVESADDVVEALANQLKPILKSPESKKKQPPLQLSVFEQKLYEAMGDAPIHIDALAEKSGFSTADALVQLLSLEFKGAIRQSPGKMFRRVS
ncbi:MAG: DNA-processing protein DprA, partial [bacterium]